MSALPPFTSLSSAPVPHFGVVLSLPEWQSLAERLQRTGMEFVMKPRIRFPGQAGEQATMFFHDPSGTRLKSRRSPTCPSCLPGNPFPTRTR